MIELSVIFVSLGMCQNVRGILGPKDRLTNGLNNILVAIQVSLSIGKAFMRLTMLEAQVRCGLQFPTILRS